MPPLITLPLSSTARRSRAARPVQIAAGTSSPPQAGPRSGQADMPISEGAPCKTFGVPHRAAGTTAARPLVTPRLRLSPSGTVSSSTPETCWHRQPSLRVCRTRRVKGSVKYVDLHSADMVSTLPARIEPQSRGQEGLVSTVRKSGVSGQQINFPGDAGDKKGGWAVANQPLLTTRTLEAVQRLQNLFARQSADKVIDLDEQRAIRRELAIVEGEARHADNCGRYAMALMRGVETVAYLETLRLRAGADPEPLDAA